MEACAELDYELKTVVVEQSDELDRSNGELNLIKLIKHHCLVGDAAKAQLVFRQFHEQSEQLVETCRMLNQVAPTNKLKITTKLLATWFQLNLRQLLNSAACLCEHPRSRESKDCAWAYFQGERRPQLVQPTGCLADAFGVGLGGPNERLETDRTTIRLIGPLKRRHQTKTKPNRNHQSGPASTTTFVSWPVSSPTWFTRRPPTTRADPRAWPNYANK